MNAYKSRAKVPPTKRERIAFEQHGLSNPEIMQEAKARTGVRFTPITPVGEQVFYGTISAQKPSLIAALGFANTSCETARYIA